MKLPAARTVGDAVRSFSRIIGRANDCLDLPLNDGRTVEVHSEFFTHVVRRLPGVRSYLIRQSGRRITFQLLTPGDVDPTEHRSGMLATVKRIFPDVEEESLDVVRLSKEEKTAAGKHRWIIKDPAPDVRGPA